MAFWKIRKLFIICSDYSVLKKIVYNEDCGSCFAVEQFVDIKLGAKDLLPLTS